MQKRFTVSSPDTRKSHRWVCIQRAGDCICSTGPEVHLQAHFLLLREEHLSCNPSTEREVPLLMRLIDAEPQSAMTSFHVAERLNSVYIGGGIFSLCASRKKASTEWILIRKWVRVAQPSGTKILHCHCEWSEWYMQDSTPDDKNPADNSWQLLWCNYQ